MVVLIQNSNPGAKKAERKPDPQGSENVRIPGGRPGEERWMVRLGIG